MGLRPLPHTPATPYPGDKHPGLRRSACVSLSALISHCFLTSISSRYPSSPGLHTDMPFLHAITPLLLLAQVAFLNSDSTLDLPFHNTPVGKPPDHLCRRSAQSSPTSPSTRQRSGHVGSPVTICWWIDQGTAFADGLDCGLRAL